MTTNKETEIILLLRDYMNFLPSGQQEAYVPVSSAFGSTSSWPITAESERRMDLGSMTGKTYKLLDSALNYLSRHEPYLYNALLVIYLSEESGHRDLDHLKEAAKKGNETAVKLIEAHNAGIRRLAHLLSNVDLYVRWPHKATGPKPGQDMQEKHDELFAIFWRNYKNGEGNLPYRQALDNAVFKMGNYYSRRHADRVIKNRLKTIENNET